MASLHPPLSLTQTNALRGVSTASAFLSLMGSSLLIYQVIAGKKTGSPQHRLLLMMSVADIIGSLRFAIFPLAFWPLEEPSPTCTADGFLSMISLAAPFYNGALSFYYVWTVKGKYTDRQIAKVHEPVMHAIILIFTTICAFVGLGLNAYNPTTSGLNCWISPYPDGCTADPDVQCERGETPFGWTPTAATLLVLLALIVNNLIIYCYVRKTHNQSRQYTDHDSVTSSVSGGVPFDPDEIYCCYPTGTFQARTLTQKVAVQSFLYVAAFFTSYISTLIVTIFFTIDPLGVAEGKYYFWSLLEGIFLPMQGAFNLLVFVRPRYLRWRRRNSRWVSFQKAIFTMETPKSTNSGAFNSKLISFPKIPKAIFGSGSQEASNFSTALGWPSSNHNRKDPSAEESEHQMKDLSISDLGVDDDDEFKGDIETAPFEESANSQFPLMAAKCVIQMRDPPVSDVEVDSDIFVKSEIGALEEAQEEQGSVPSEEHSDSNGSLEDEMQMNDPPRRGNKIDSIVVPVTRNVANDEPQAEGRPSCNDQRTPVGEQGNCLQNRVLPTADMEADDGLVENEMDWAAAEETQRESRPSSPSKEHHSIEEQSNDFEHDDAKSDLETTTSEDPQVESGPL